MYMYIYVYVCIYITYIYTHTCIYMYIYVEIFIQSRLWTVLINLLGKWITFKIMVKSTNETLITAVRCSPLSSFLFFFLPSHHAELSTEQLSLKIINKILTQLISNVYVCQTWKIPASFFLSHQSGSACGWWEPSYHPAVDSLSLWLDEACLP